MMRKNNGQSEYTSKRKVACSLMKENMPLDKIASIIDVGVKELEKWKTEME